MSKQSSPSTNQRWVDALHPELVTRLTQPLTQPGLLNMQQTYAVVGRTAQMLPALPLAEAVGQRWGTAVATLGEQLPIIYVQPANVQPANVQPANVQPAEYAQLASAQPQAQPDKARQLDTLPWDTQDQPRPIVHPLPTSADESVMKTVPAATTTTQRTEADQSQASVGTTNLPEAQATSVYAAHNQPGALEPSAESSGQANLPAESAVASSTSSASAGVIQRMPNHSSQSQVNRHPATNSSTHPPIHLRSEEQDQSLSIRHDNLGDKPTAQHASRAGSASKPTPITSSPIVVQAKMADDQTQVPFVRPRPLIHNTKSLPQESPSGPTSLGLSSLGSTSLPIVREQVKTNSHQAGKPSPPSLSSAFSTPPVAQATTPDAAPLVTPAAMPVAQARSTASIRRVPSQPVRWLPLAGAASTGVIQRSPMPASKSATPANSSGVGRGYGRTEDTTGVIQRQPANNLVQPEQDVEDATVMNEAPQVDIDALVEQVERRFMHQLAIEGERRGMTSWPS